MQEKKEEESTQELVVEIKSIAQQLPPEVLAHTLGFLNKNNDKRAARKVCKFFRDAIDWGDERDYNNRPKVHILYPGLLNYPCGHITAFALLPNHRIALFAELETGGSGSIYGLMFLNTKHLTYTGPVNSPVGERYTHLHALPNGDLIALPKSIHSGVNSYYSTDGRKRYSPRDHYVVILSGITGKVKNRICVEQCSYSNIKELRVLSSNQCIALFPQSGYNNERSKNINFLIDIEKGVSKPISSSEVEELSKNKYSAIEGEPHQGESSIHRLPDGNELRITPSSRPTKPMSIDLLEYSPKRAAKEPEREADINLNTKL